MKTVHKSVLIWYSPQQMFDLVTDVNEYPEFLPWCAQARIIETHDDGVTAEIGIAFGEFRQTFTTRNEHQAARSVHMKLLNGPFTQLDGHWHFHPLGDDAQAACKVELSLQYDFSNGALGSVVSPVFEKVAGNLMDAFVKRAEQVYGE